MSYERYLVHVWYLINLDGLKEWFLRGIQWKERRSSFVGGQYVKEILALRPCRGVLIANAMNYIYVFLTHYLGSQSSPATVMKI